ncbi:MAG: phenylalanine--tRNA ligase subunit beta, partial [Rhodocyclaceae bacterium]|nr:phenylalanine--tRNA ligase subunit beta [Rhodocyclaceae bacterium]
HWQGRARSVDFYDLKGDIETLFPNCTLTFRPLAEHPALHPGRAASIVLDGQIIGFLGELHPAHLQAHNLQQPIVAAEIDLEQVLATQLPRYREFSRQPIVTRDIAFTAPAALTAAELLDTLRQAAGDEILAIELFDVYQGEHLADGQKSLAFRVLLQDTHKTLEDAQVDALVARMRQHACDTLGVTLRS